MDYLNVFDNLDNYDTGQLDWLYIVETYFTIVINDVIETHLKVVRSRNVESAFQKLLL